MQFRLQGTKKTISSVKKITWNSFKNQNEAYGSFTSEWFQELVDILRTFNTYLCREPCTQTFGICEASQQKAPNVGQILGKIDGKI